MKTFDYNTTYQALLKLYEASLLLLGTSTTQARTFIEVGEYGLALEWIADSYIENNAAVPATMFALFETLAANMELETDPEYSAIADLRQRGPNPTR